MGMERYDFYRYEGGYTLYVQQHFSLYSDTYSAQLSSGETGSDDHVIHWSGEDFYSWGGAKHAGEQALAALREKEAA